MRATGAAGPRWAGLQARLERPPTAARRQRRANGGKPAIERGDERRVGLGFKLAAAVRGRDQLLDSYSAERHPVAARVRRRRAARRHARQGPAAHARRWPRRAALRADGQGRRPLRLVFGTCPARERAAPAHARHELGIDAGSPRRLRARVGFDRRSRAQGPAPHARPGASAELADPALAQRRHFSSIASIYEGWGDGLCASAQRLLAASGVRLDREDG
jgi:hypothetical protein